MPKKKLPDTSLAAYEQAKPMINPHHEKILSALSVIGKSIYEKIADHLKMDKHQIGRRLSELESMQLVHKPGTKGVTKTGRSAYEYELTPEGGKVEISKEFVYKKGQESAADAAVKLIHSAKKKIPVITNQEPLFKL